MGQSHPAYRVNFLTWINAMEMIALGANHPMQIRDFFPRLIVSEDVQFSVLHVSSRSAHIEQLMQKWDTGGCYLWPDRIVNE